MKRRSISNSWSAAKGTMAMKSITPAGLTIQRRDVAQAADPAMLDSGATQRRKAYSAEKTQREKISTTLNTRSHAAWISGTVSSTAATMLTKISAMIARWTKRTARATGGSR